MNSLIHWISGTKYAIMLNHAVSLQNFLCWFGLYLDWSFNHACWWWILNRDSAYNFWAFNMSEKRQTEYLLLISFSTCTLICPSLISDPLRNKLYNEVEGVEPLVSIYPNQSDRTHNYQRNHPHWGIQCLLLRLQIPPAYCVQVFFSYI